MDPKWNEDQPIYRQLRDRVVTMILEGVLVELIRPADPIRPPELENRFSEEGVLKFGWLVTLKASAPT